LGRQGCLLAYHSFSTRRTATASTMNHKKRATPVVEDEESLFKPIQQVCV